VHCRVILFDLDGVLVDSLRCVELVWQAWAAERGLDAAPFLAIAHGRRISETIRMVRPDLDARAEAAVLDAMEEVETRGLSPAPGAADLLAQLGDRQWAIVTSGSRVVATLRLRTAGIPIPKVFVTSNDVRRGKPDPEGYLLAAGRLGVEPADCLVFEDSPPGVGAGKAAGMRVIALLTTHRADALTAADAHVPSLAALRLDAGPAGLDLRY
jgi:mannitol-1-/sugar-/sorbitol-6-phosphatase